MGSSVSVDIRMDDSAIKRLTRSQSGPVGQRFVQFVNRVTNTAKEYANVDTGLMRSTIRYDITEGPDGLEATVGAYTDYAIYVHELVNPFLTDALATESSRGF